MKYLVTGGCGFVGSNIAAEVLRRGDELVVFDNLSRYGSNINLAWLESLGDFRFIHGDTRNSNDVENCVREVRPDAIFHLAGQVAMTTSLANPRRDFEINTMGTLNVLESVRKYSPATSILYSSTNKVYGDLVEYTYSEERTRYVCIERPNGFDESTPLCFQSPYGCSKGAADQYLLDYHRMFGLKTVVFRHSSMYGGRQFATYDQGWVGWFCQKALESKRGAGGEPFTISGDGKQVRDLLFASDVAELYFAASSKIDSITGEAFNIGGGLENSLSLLELFSELESRLDVKLLYERRDWRASDQRVFIADITKAQQRIGWRPKVTKDAGITKMLAWLGEDAS
jgi:CDP-paratose 2-epimerase